MDNRAYPHDMRPEDMDWSRTQPCNDCPFLKSSPFHQGVAAGLPLVMQSIQDGLFSHTCHKTDNRPNCDGPRSYPGRTQHCAGAILMLLKTARGMDLQLALLQAAERGDIDIAKMTARAKESKDIFTVFQMLHFYARESAAKEIE